MSLLSGLPQDEICLCQYTPGPSVVHCLKNMYLCGISGTLRQHIPQKQEKGLSLLSCVSVRIHTEKGSNTKRMDCMPMDRKCYIMVWHSVACFRKKGKKKTDFQNTAWGWRGFVMQEMNLIAKAFNKPPNDLHFLQWVMECQWSFMYKGIRTRFVIQESNPGSNAVGGLKRERLI